MKSKGLVYGILIGAICAAGALAQGCATYMSGSVKSSVVINAPVEEVYAWVTSPENHDKRLQEQEITDQHGSGLGAGYHFYSKSPFGVFQGDQVVVEYVPNQLWVEQTVTGLDGTGTYTWIFLDQGGKTEVIKVGQITQKAPLPAQMLGEKKITGMAQAAQDEELRRIKAAIEK